jgi:voltage-gated sodium channel
MRMVKLLKQAKQLQVIIGALISGMRSIMVIFMLLVMVMVMFGTVGTIYLGPNDPWHFKDFHTSVISLFTLVTLNDWSNVMQVGAASTS